MGGGGQDETIGGLSLGGGSEIVSVPSTPPPCIFKWNSRQAKHALYRNFGISFFVTFSAILRLSRDKSVVTRGGTGVPGEKPPPNPKSLATFSHVPDGIRTHTG